MQCIFLQKMYFLLCLNLSVFFPVSHLLYRRTRNIFDVALSVHKGIQQRDLSAGKNVGNFILRFLDRARPSANIRGSCAKIKDVGRVKDDNRTTGNLPIMKSTQSEVNKHLFSRHDLNGSQLGSQLSNRYIVGTVCPGSQNTLKSAPGARSFFTLVHGMDITFPSPRLLPAKSIFREDIAQWMIKK